MLPFTHCEPESILQSTTADTGRKPGNCVYHINEDRSAVKGATLTQLDATKRDLIITPLLVSTLYSILLTHKAKAHRTTISLWYSDSFAALTKNVRC